MSNATFSLQRFRFDNITASAPDLAGTDKHQMEMKFEIGFHSDEAPEGCDFTVTIGLKFMQLIEGKTQDILLAKARGAYKYQPGSKPHTIEDPLERTYAVTALYGCMRPTLDVVIGDIGLGGFSLPLSLPLEVIESEHNSDLEQS